MYSFVLRPKVVIPYVPPREAKVLWVCLGFGWLARVQVLAGMKL